MRTAHRGRRVAIVALNTAAIALWWLLGSGLPVPIDFYIPLLATAAHLLVYLLVL